MKRSAIIIGVACVVIGVAYFLNAGAMHPIVSRSDEGFSDMETSDRDVRPFSITKALKEFLLLKDIRDYRAAMQKDPFVYDTYEVTDHYYGILGPDIMLDVLEEDPHCHLKSHNLGRLIYIKNDRDLSEALTIAGGRCTYGAFHGILTQVLDDSVGNTGTSTQDHVTDDAFVKTALSFCDRDEVREKANEATCVHSIGHAMMLLEDNDIGKALKQCKVFPSKLRQYYCATGVFMQREKVSGLEDAESKQFPCDTYEHPAACYRYKLRDVFPHDSFAAAHKLCLSLPEGVERNGCFHGLGFTYYMIPLKSPQKLPILCASENETDRRMCVEGVAGRIEIYYKRDTVESVCTSQAADIRGWCEKALYAGSGFGINGSSDNIDSYYRPKATSR